MTKEAPIKSLKDMLGLLGEQMDQLRPKNKPAQESVAAARASATVVNSYLGVVKIGMEYAKMNGQRPDLGFLGLPVQKQVNDAAKAIA